MTGPTMVVKIGGSVLTGPQDYAGAAHRIAGSLLIQPIWIVISAARGVTDQLKQAPQVDGDLIDALVQRHQELAGRALPAWLDAELHRGLSEARQGRRAVILSWGEQASAWCLQQRLGDVGLDVPLVELYPRRRLPAEACAIVPGFYLRDRHGRARTLPRGGSDITAALLALRLGTGRIHFWKDGGGIHASPGVVLQRTDASSLLRRIGSDIRPLHPAALRIAQRHNLEFVLEDPSGRFPSTRIVGREEPVLAR